MADVSQRVVMDLRTNLFRHVLNQSAAFFSRTSTGQLMSRITNDVNQVQFVVSETLADLVRESLAVVGFAGLLLYYDWRLALIVLVTAPLSPTRATTWPACTVNEALRSWNPALPS
jgi:subfamily B ATP-binding cassette protein MsbA